MIDCEEATHITVATSSSHKIPFGSSSVDGWWETYFWGPRRLEMRSLLNTKPAFRIPAFIVSALKTLSARNHKQATTMASTPINNPISFSLLTLLLLLSLLSLSSLSLSSTPTTPIPTPWPHQFHSLLFMNLSGTLQALDLWYDWPNGRNFNIIQNQLGKLTYDLEWNNGTSFIYTLDSSRECRVWAVEVGILRPDWLDGANYLGQRYMDGFLCNVWEKVEFIWYYEDVVSKRPVFWVFYSGYAAHVMTFEVGRVLEDARWQAPVYCFEETGEKKSPLVESVANVGLHGRSMRGVMNTTSSL